MRRPHSPRHQPVRHRQGGVAVVTALLLTTLAITIVASLFWQQQVQVRSIENQRLQLQKRWILRGALDWASLILRADSANSQIDHLGEPWAVPLAETRLDQYLENGRTDADASDATISGNIVDAQSRFNLRNLLSADDPNLIDPGELATFQNLLTELRLNPSLAQATAVALRASTFKPAPGAVPGAATPSPAAASDARILSIDYLDDLLAIPGFTTAIIDKLKDYVIILPSRTPINANTAPLEVLAAKMATIPSLSKADATTLVAARETAYFKDLADIGLRLQKPTAFQQPPSFDVSTRYFMVNGKVRLNRAALEMQALVERNIMTTRLIWIREY